MPSFRCSPAIRCGASPLSTPLTGAGTDHANDYPFGGKAITGQLVINAPGGNANITQSFIYSPSGEPRRS